ncbi:hypothetical protein M758_5G049700 [Ceratodon purpureus]|nr:hypothetical protein M758_5G049700 [Ceratodon purpureus]
MKRIAEVSCLDYVEIWLIFHVKIQKQYMVSNNFHGWLFVIAQECNAMPGTSPTLHLLDVGQAFAGINSHFKYFGALLDLCAKVSCSSLDNIFHWLNFFFTSNRKSFM